MSNKEPSFTVRAQIRCLFTLGTCMVLTPGMQSVVELLLLLLLLWQVACCAHGKECLHSAPSTPLLATYPSERGACDQDERVLESNGRQFLSR